MTAATRRHLLDTSMVRGSLPDALRELNPGTRYK